MRECTLMITYDRRTKMPATARFAKQKNILPIDSVTAFLSEGHNNLDSW